MIGVSVRPLLRGYFHVNTFWGDFGELILSGLIVFIGALFCIKHLRRPHLMIPVTTAVATLSQGQVLAVRCNTRVAAPHVQYQQCRVK